METIPEEGVLKKIQRRLSRDPYDVDRLQLASNDVLQSVSRPGSIQSNGKYS